MNYSAPKPTPMPTPAPTTTTTAAIVSSTESSSGAQASSSVSGSGDNGSVAQPDATMTDADGSLVSATPSSHTSNSAGHVYSPLATTLAVPSSTPTSDEPDGATDGDVVSETTLPWPLIAGIAGGVCCCCLLIVLVVVLLMRRDADDSNAAAPMRDDDPSMYITERAAPASYASEYGNVNIGNNSDSQNQYSVPSFNTPSNASHNQYSSVPSFNMNASSAREQYSAPPVAPSRANQTYTEVDFSTFDGSNTPPGSSTPLGSNAAPSSVDTQYRMLPLAPNAGERTDVGGLQLPMPPSDNQYASVALSGRVDLQEDNGFYQNSAFPTTPIQN